MSGLVIVGLLLAGQVVPPPRADGAARAAPLRAEFREILKAEAEGIERLASKAPPDEAARLRALTGPDLPPDVERFVPLPEFAPNGGGPALPDAARSLRAATAGKLRDLARRAAGPEVERFGLAAECLRAALEREPDDRETRRLLGYVPVEDGWATPHAAENRKAGMVLDPTFGWVPGDWPPHLERGELPGIIAPGRPVPWLPAAEADALRANFQRRPWQITTEHFELRTNVPLAEAIRFGRRLEALHDLYFTFFADLVEPKDLPLAQRFREPKSWAAATTTRYPVWYFAAQAEYVALFRERFGRDESVSLGYFMPASEAARYRQPPRSYFFRDGQRQGGDMLPTLFHEASHQLLFETAGTSGYARNVGHYWVWEGLGAYFETVAPQADGSYLLGRLDGSPLSKARADQLREALEARVNFLGIEELTGLGPARYRNEELVTTHYAEGMALAVFLMHGDGGRYRDGFLDYVLDAYRGRFRTGGSGRPLPERLGVEARELDQAFRAFVRRGTDRRAPTGPLR